MSLPDRAVVADNPSCLSAARDYNHQLATCQPRTMGLYSDHCRFEPLTSQVKQYESGTGMRQIAGKGFSSSSAVPKLPTETSAQPHSESAWKIQPAAEDDLCNPLFKLRRLQVKVRGPASSVSARKLGRLSVPEHRLSHGPFDSTPRLFASSQA